MYNVYIWGDRYNEADASGLLTCCNINTINCDLNHVGTEGLGNNIQLPRLSVWCRNITSLSNSINHEFVNASVNEVTNKSKLHKLLS